MVPGAGYVSRLRLHADIERGDSKRQRLALGPRQPCPEHPLNQGLRLGKQADAGREIIVSRLPVRCQRLADPGQQAAEVPGVERRQRPGCGGWRTPARPLVRPAGRRGPSPAARDPGRSSSAVRRPPRRSGTCCPGKATRGRRPQPGRSAARRGTRGRGQRVGYLPRVAALPAGDGQHRPAEVGPEDTAVRLSPAIGQRQVAAARTHVQDWPRPVRRRHRSHHPPPPGAVHAQRQDVVQQIVAAGDLAEHPADPRGGLVNAHGVAGGW